MSLYWPPDAGAVVLDAPRLHALVVGVGTYPHLLGGVPQLIAEDPLFLGQLTTTPVTAKRIAEWLVRDYHNPACPLGSVELLLSPEDTLETPEGNPVQVERADMDSIREAAFRWADRCDTHEDNIAFFYFAGHGLSTTSVYLLAADFGANPNAFWANCIDFDGMNRGMRKTKARAQLFFVDACREYAPSPDNVVTGDPLITRAARGIASTEGVYFAAQEGLKAYGPRDEITYFSQALLAALEGVGAENTDGTPQVDHGSLGNAINKIMEDLPVREGKKLSSQANVQGDTVVFHRPRAKLVRTSIRCATEGADPESDFELVRGPTVHRSPRGEDRPWIRHLEAGDWTIKAAFERFPAIERVENLSSTIRRIELRHE